MKLLRKLIIPSSFYLRFLSLVTVILFISITKSFASQITLMWDASTENDIAGYKIFYGNSSGNYNSIIDVSNQTSYTISDLVDGNTYYIALTAYDVRGNESGFSKEISDVASTSGNNSPVLSYVDDKMIRQTKNSWSGPVYATMHSRFVHRTDCEKLISNTERKTITGEIVQITENLIMFPSIGQALRDGGVPCSICNP
ncbi:MAG: fibronectin type III domain-containing protein [Candidatus Scalindua sp.]|nr:fibronectin type III domain-containing protein [Candidatus Scalindua sp.]